MRHNSAALQHKQIMKLDVPNNAASKREIVCPRFNTDCARNHWRLRSAVGGFIYSMRRSKSIRFSRCSAARSRVAGASQSTDLIACERMPDCLRDGRRPTKCPRRPSDRTMPVKSEDRHNERSVRPVIFPKTENVIGPPVSYCASSKCASTTTASHSLRVHLVGSHTCFRPASRGSGHACGAKGP